MKNITDILKGIGIEVPEDKKAEFEAAVNANYKTIAEFEKKDAKIQTLADQLKTAQDGLKEFEGVDVKDLKGQIDKLTGDIKAKESEYQNKLADYEFNHLLSDAITGAKGRNSKAIIAMLDVEALKASKNQAADIKKALEDVKKENDYLFEKPGKQNGYASETGDSGMQAGKVDSALAAFAKGAGIEMED